MGNVRASGSSFVAVRYSRTGSSVTPVYCGATNVGLVPINNKGSDTIATRLLGPFKGEGGFFAIGSRTTHARAIVTTNCNRSSVVGACHTVSGGLLRLGGGKFLGNRAPFSTVITFLSLCYTCLVNNRCVILSGRSDTGSKGVRNERIGRRCSGSCEFRGSFARCINRGLLSNVHCFDLLQPFSRLRVTGRFTLLPRCRGIFHDYGHNDGGGV